MTRLAAVLAAFVAVLVLAPSALAASFVVNSNADDPDANPDPICDTGTGPGVQCTLRAAIKAADDTPGADTITFAAGGRAPVVASPLPQVTDQLSIDGGGQTVVDFSASASNRQLDVAAANSLIRAITLQNASGTAINLGASGDRLDTVTVKSATGTAVRLGGDNQRADGLHVQGGNATGILVNGASDTITSPVISGLGGPGIDIGGPNAVVTSPDITSTQDGIRVSGAGAGISGGTVHGVSGNGVSISGQNDTVSRVVFYANSGKPIALTSGANGGIAPPQNLRIGPRRADGSLPLTGTSHAGTIELWAGDPSGGSAPSFFDAFSSGGDFTYNFPSDPQPGARYALGVNAGGVGSSEFATVTVPADITSPDVVFARATDTSDVRVDFTEPLDPNSVQPGDFTLTMAGADRPISSLAVSPDGRFVTLGSSGWKAGEAGYLQFAAPGSVTDSSGNAMLSAPRIRVAAAPGDFVAPLGGRLSISPRTICLTHTRTCRRTGMTIKFVSSEAGKATLLVKRSNKTVGKRLYGNIVAGLNTLKWNGRLGSRKLRAGRYRLLIYVQDQVGNVTDQPPITLFNVRRATK